MPPFESPGVYVREVPSGSAPIAGVGTAIAAFIGLAAKGPCNEPTLVTTWDQYVKTFGAIPPGTYLGHAVHGYLLNGGKKCYIVRVGQGSDDDVEQSPAKARLGHLEVRALEAGPAGNGTTVEVSAPPEGSPEGTVRIVVTRGDEREEHEAVPLSGRGNVVSTLEQVEARACRARGRRRPARRSPVGAHRAERW